jgi:chemotaxis protein MotB
MPEGRPIIVIKKKVNHGGHHGGAWKVAYADFVTAMMALFIVLWLMNSSKKVQEAVGGYFKDPTGTSNKAGTNLAGSGENFELTNDNMEQLKTELQKAVRNVTEFEKLKNQVEMTVTAEGLRIELMEDEAGTFFESGATQPTSSCRDVLTKLAGELGKLPNKILLEGHTDATPFGGKSSYSNWELSADRANAVRRLMQEAGVRPDQVSQVRGYADQRLRDQTDAHDPSNRRISLIVQYQPKPDEDEEEDEDEKKASPPAAKSHH